MTGYPIGKIDAMAISVLNAETLLPVADKMAAVVHQTRPMMNPIESRLFHL
jgi:hypothetical protein